MTRVFVHGLGAVSPAGWGMAALRASLEQNCPLPTQTLARPGWENPLIIRAVPPPSNKPAFLAHARLRRASPMAHYAVAAALEALGADADLIRFGAIRLGIVTCTMTGGLSYSRRFYQEVLHDPATASPLLFAETVFNAPASHLSAFLGTATVNYTLVGDAGSFLQGLAVAAQWLEEGVADAGLVIGAEESDWTAADALRLFARKAVHSTGAGALYLKRSREPSDNVEMAAVTDIFPATGVTGRTAAAEQMRRQLPAGSPNELLCASASPDTAWKDWPGARLASQAVLGEAFAASAAWQCAAACDALQRCQYEAANVTITGAGRQAIGARFVKSNIPSS